jgi:hypothetical protein
MTTKDPTRLSGLTDVPELADVVRAARDVRPPPAMVARLAARLQLPAPGGTTASDALRAGVSGVAPAPVASAGKLVLLGSAVLGAGLLLWLATSGAGKTENPMAAASASVSAPVAHVESESVAPAPVVQEQPTPASEPTPVAVPAKPSELALISEAERLRTSAPARALALTEEDSRLYPHGALSEERDVLTIEALAKLGRLPRARALAQSFEKRYPSSGYLKRLQHAIGSTDQK